MDWKVAATTFGIVLLAEMGDKTQLAALALSGQSGRPMSVWLGSVFALAAASLIGVLAGAALSKIVPPRALEIGAAVLFLAVGAFLLFRALVARA